MTDARYIRVDTHVVSVSPVLPAYVAWADEHPEDSGDTLTTFVAGWYARDDEVAALRAEIARLKGEQP